MREVYFSPDATMEHFAQFQPMVQDESMLVLTEMMSLAMRLPKKRPRIPALVIGGQLDALFAANRLHFTASGWNAETCVIPRAGHDRSAVGERCGKDPCLAWRQTWIAWPRHPARTRDAGGLN
ncbi:MAG: hypothetical protein IPP84_00065 [Propionivibrio sp.]|uniref:hypothetical protein n=1 Tax=Propionivibrio sp. TaxID=2212460 RepID=UPI0025EFAC2B|nr:hypothetical protein [Propionivibrio sp.]MBL0206400.1 hypothetical protein [Propionivibrio sp.]